MQNWKGLMIAAVVTAIVVAVFIKYSSDRLYKDDKRPTGGAVGDLVPNFEGDFAINGQVLRLSDLKGKVVLLDFWAVWCPPCIKSFPHLRHLQEKFGNDGFQIVGVTDYNCESGRGFYGFDKSKGAAVKMPSGNKSTEQQMLKEFAAYHKLAHLLVVLPRNEATKTFDAYDVELIPRMVLIDRKGIIRLIGEGADQETAIAKLLAERS